MTVSELVVLTFQASNACKSLKDHFSSLPEDGKKEYQTWIRQEIQRDGNMINPIIDLADIINDAIDRGLRINSSSLLDSSFTYRRVLVPS